MQENINATPVLNTDQFGITEQDYKRSNIKNFFSKLKYYLQIIEPAFVKVFNVILYYLIKFIKSFVTSMFQMIKGG